jgi:hypothetical protein
VADRLSVPVPPATLKIKVPMAVQLTARADEGVVNKDPNAMAPASNPMPRDFRILLVMVSPPAVTGGLAMT